MVPDRFNIVQKFPNHEIFYFDSLAGGIFEGTKSEAQKILFLLSMQNEGVFEMRKKQ